MTTPTYVAPKLERAGTFRQLTQAARKLSNTKSVIGTDAVIPGLDCDPSDPTNGCVRS